jgi:hypothetical protein
MLANKTSARFFLTTCLPHFIIHTIHAEYNSVDLSRD